MVNMNNKVLIVGKSGYIAGALGDFLETNTNNIIKYSSSSNVHSDIKLNLQNMNDFNYKQIEDIDVVYMLAGISSPDFCSEQQKLCREINVIGTKKFISVCLKHQKKVIFASSDVVYGQKEKAVDEQTMTYSPIGIYGQMKQEIEEYFQNDKNFKSTRFSYVFSRDDKFTKYLYECEKNNTKASIFHPLKRSIISLSDVLTSLAELPNLWDKIESPFVNFCGHELISRLDIAKSIQRLCLPQLKYEVVKPSTSFYEARPETINMKSIFLKKILKRNIETLDEMVKNSCPKT